MKTSITNIQCNCCNARVVDMAEKAEPFANTGVITLLYSTTRNAYVCERCVVAHMILIANDGNPVLVYNIEKKKYQATNRFKRTYLPELKHDPDEIIAGDSHLKYDLQTHVEKSKGTYRVQAPPKTADKEKAPLPILNKTAEVNEQVLDAVFG